MSSGIDSSKPADDVPAVKEDLRANLETARVELNHGGFATSLSPAHYGPAASTRVEDHLAAIDTALGSGGGAGSFIELDDTPGAYSGESSKFVKVRSDETGLEFVTSGGATNADAVDYSPAWNGAVTRSAEARLMDEAHVEDFGATGDGDDAAAIQAAIDSPAVFIVFGPTSYAIGSRLNVPQGKTLIFKGTTISGHANLPTTGDESTLFRFDGTTVSGLRGNGIIGTASFHTGGRALYGISIGASPDQSRFDVYGMPIIFQAGFTRCIRMVSGGWYNFRLRGIRTNPVADGGVAIDLQDSDGTTFLLDSVNVDLNGTSSTATRGFLLEAESIQMNTCSVDGAPPGAAAIECVKTALGGHVQAFNLHLEGNEGYLIKLGPDNNNQFHWFGGLVHAPSEHTGTLFDIGANATLSLNHVRFRAFTNWATFASIGSGGILKVYEGTRDLSASSPWNQFSGSGEAFQMWKGKRINLHNSP